MQKDWRTPSFAQLVIHCGMGAILGALLAVALMVANRDIFRLIASSSSPLTEMAFFVGFISFVFAIGATLSGFIFTAIELNSLEAKRQSVAKVDDSRRSRN
jgi:NhaP-type Na+/H+ or K+/H+ antiporter